MRVLEFRDAKYLELPAVLCPGWGIKPGPVSRRPCYLETQKIHFYLITADKWRMVKGKDSVRLRLWINVILFCHIPNTHL